MQAEDEFGHDAEVAATAPQTPQKIRVLLVTRTHDIAVCGNDRRRQQVVDGQSHQAIRPPHAAA